MNLEEMSKEELLQYIHHLEKQRAYSYEDQIKLSILDRSPFTIWASDRNCRIRLWSGQCESMYGRSKEEVLGEDFVELFVAQDEQAAARRDQLEIIDNNKVFHNIANDQARNGNTLQLITNCFRIVDPISGEFWNAEMGVAIDYYEKERKQLEENIAEGKLIQLCISNFMSIQRQYREQFFGRKGALLAALHAGERDAIKARALGEYRRNCIPIRERISAIEARLSSEIERSREEITKCVTSQSCEDVRLSFIKTYNALLDDYEDIVSDFEQISVEYSIQESAMLKDSVMKSTTVKNTHFANMAQELWLKAEKNIKEYKALGEIDPESARLKNLIAIRESICELKEEIDAVADSIYYELSNSDNDNAVMEGMKEMERRYETIREKLEEIKIKMGDQ